MTTPGQELEQQVRKEISATQLQEHLTIFSTFFRDTGSEDEWRAARYLVEQLQSYGVRSEILEFDALISWPLEGRLIVLDDQGKAAESFEVRTRSFGAQTPAGGLTGELIFVPFQQPKPGEMIFSHRAVAGDYSGLDVRGKFVLTSDGGPDGVLRAQERGAAGHIHIWPSDEDVTHEMICSSIWGTPTPETAERLPKIPALGVKHALGERLRQLAQQGQVRVLVESNVKTEWMHMPLATGFIPGNGAADYLLVGAHIDSWYEGITDNATGDVALLEMARVLSMVREQLRCGVRFCWWPGHSTGRYAGSTWYADNYFRDLHEHCLGYLNIDSPGVRETTIFDCRYNMGEIEHITAGAVNEVTGQEPNLRRPLRAGDQSFLGVGLPSLGAFRMLALEHPDRKAVGGCGGAYWWHSPEDTLDKADASILAEDVAVYITITLRVCQPAIIPYQFGASAQDFIDHLATLQETAGEHVDLSTVQAAATEYQEAARRLAASTATNVERRNDGLKRITRIINPVLFTIHGPYEMDPALQLPVLPGLAPLHELVQLAPTSDQYQFLRTKLIRQRNRIEDALRQAALLARQLLE